jgi:SAM-dependent methyltransferase
LIPLKFLNFSFNSFPLRRIFKTPVLERFTEPMSFCEWEYQRTEQLLRPYRRYISLENRDILDIGCGLGGKSTYYAMNGASSVKAVDIDPERLVHAKAFAEHKNTDNIEFLELDACCLPADFTGHFHLLILMDSLEHIDEPGRILAESYRVLKKGGHLVIGFPPYLSPWGAHLFAHIRVPWAHLLLPEGMLVQIWKDAESKCADGRILSRENFKKLQKATRIDELHHLNRMTIDRYESIVEDSPFQTRFFCLQSLLRCLSVLIPKNRSREYLTTRVMAILEKL